MISHELITSGLLLLAYLLGSPSPGVWCWRAFLRSPIFAATAAATSAPPTWRGWPVPSWVWLPSSGTL